MAYTPPISSALDFAWNSAEAYVEPSGDTLFLFFGDGKGTAKAGLPLIVTAVGVVPPAGFLDKSIPLSCAGSGVVGHKCLANGRFPLAMHAVGSLPFTGQTLRNIVLAASGYGVVRYEGVVEHLLALSAVSAGIGHAVGTSASSLRIKGASASVVAVIGEAHGRTRLSCMSAGAAISAGRGALSFGLTIHASGSVPPCGNASHALKPKGEAAGHIGRVGHARSVMPLSGVFRVVHGRKGAALHYAKIEASAAGGHGVTGTSASMGMLHAFALGATPTSFIGATATQLPISARVVAVTVREPEDICA